MADECGRSVKRVSSDDDASRSFQELGTFARLLYRERRVRDDVFELRVLNEGGWDLLLELYASMAERRKVSVMNACVAACIPPSTAQRLVARLEQLGIILRHLDDKDRRVHLLTLSPRSLAKMSECLGRILEMRT